MKLLDTLLSLLLPSLILLHLLAAPYTKVEESFNLQATHDILLYSTPTHAIGARLRAAYDHFTFPGAVPRTFVGAATLAGLSRPILSVIGWRHGQLVVRGVLGLGNALALLRFRGGLEKAFGRGTARWFVVLLAGQFHVLFYASRTLPNIFAFGLCTLAMGEVLPIPAPSSKGGLNTTAKRHKLAIYLLVLAGVVFRSEVAILLATQLFSLLVQPAISLQTIIPVGLRSAVVALAISVPIDSYFWQRPVWPELAGFFYNAIQGKSAEWGTSPIYSYFTSFLPKLLLNPAIALLLIPTALYFPATRRPAVGLVAPSLAFIAIYSLQPHKEARFIIYAVPPLTACAALGANYIFTRRYRSLLNRLLSLLIILSIIASFAASTFMLLISSLNYPGGEALFRLHEIVTRDEQAMESVRIHMDVLACMTGVSRFQQDSPTPPLSHYVSQLGSRLFANATESTQVPSASIAIRYDKTEDPDLLLDPLFWTQFDYVLAEHPETVIGKWDVIDTIYGYAGVEFLRPGAVSRSGIDSRYDAGKVWEDLGGAVDESHGAEEGDGASREVKHVTKSQEFWENAQRVGFYGAAREGTRRWISRGWWVGPRMEAKIRILKRSSDT